MLIQDSQEMCTAVDRQKHPQKRGCLRVIRHVWGWSSKGERNGDGSDMFVMFAYICGGSFDFKVVRRNG